MQFCIALLIFNECVIIFIQIPKYISFLTNKTEFFKNTLRAFCDDILKFFASQEKRLRESELAREPRFAEA